MTERPGRPDIPYPDRLFIDGDWRTPVSTRRIAVVDPTTEAVIAEVTDAGIADIEAAIGAARNAFDHGPWPRLSHSERAAVLKRIADALRRRAGPLGHLWTMQVGVLHRRATSSATGAAAQYDYYASLAEDFPFEEPFDATGGGKGLLSREPVGVVGAIVPWNAPLLLAALKTAPALLAGCTIVLKASPEAPFELHLLAEAAAEAGLPPGVLNLVTADREASERLVTHPDVDKISFTGSSAAGRRIGALCGGRIARCTLELGGKSPALVLDDADIGATATLLADASLRLSGQVCAALTRVVVPASRHDAMTDALATAFDQARPGDPYDDASDLGPLVSEAQLGRVEQHIRTAQAEGARLASGGLGERQAAGYFVRPTLFADVANEAAIAREEVFGPVLAIIPARDEEDAIRIANDSPYGLNAAIFTEDRDRAERAARRLRSGTVAWNRFGVDFRGAFGGFKQSGIGREGGREGLLPYLETKTLLL